jgi:hypothetical protein
MRDVGKRPNPYHRLAKCSGDHAEEKTDNDKCLEFHCLFLDPPSMYSHRQYFRGVFFVFAMRLGARAAWSP